MNADAMKALDLEAHALVGAASILIERTAASDTASDYEREQAREWLARYERFEADWAAMRGVA